ncbi:hypothetical protein P7K49_002007 [Saguinus oedipus]|uniref:Uncharacterized protein n=1 Tax=Saguinus oedipus TaxID=9490 RepID=A0ABQ9WH23_SAGOE|nr:hypothetical protein P7K49_002007 [Saguinus oedipus]
MSDSACLEKEQSSQLSGPPSAVAGCPAPLRQADPALDKWHVPSTSGLFVHLHSVDSSVQVPTWLVGSLVRTDSLDAYLRSQIPHPPQTLVQRMHGPTCRRTQVCMDPAVDGPYSPVERPGFLPVQHRLVQRMQGPRRWPEGRKLTAVSLLHCNSGCDRKVPRPEHRGAGACASLERQGWWPWFLMVPGEPVEPPPAPPGSLCAHPTQLQLLAPRGGGMGVASHRSPWLGSHCGLPLMGQRRRHSETPITPPTGVVTHECLDSPGGPPAVQAPPSCCSFWEHYLSVQVVVPGLELNGRDPGALGRPPLSSPT